MSVAFSSLLDKVAKNVSLTLLLLVLVTESIAVCVICRWPFALCQPDNPANNVTLLSSVLVLVVLVLTEGIAVCVIRRWSLLSSG